MDTELEGMCDRLHDLEVFARSNENEQKELKALILLQMKKLKLDKVDRVDYYVRIGENIVYNFPEPYLILEILGEENGMQHLTAKPSVRKALPPDQVEKLCPVKIRTPYVELKFKSKQK
jgi:hypothetical protein